MMRISQNFTLKMEGQCHSSRSNNGSNILKTSLSFHVNRSSYSWYIAFSNFDIENQRSGSWVRSNFKVTKWIKLSIDLSPFRSISIGHHIPEIGHFQNKTLKIKSQAHSSRSQSGSNILLTHISFVPCQSDLTSLRHGGFKMWHWNPRSRSLLRRKVANKNRKDIRQNVSNGMSLKHTRWEAWPGGYVY